MMLKSGDKEEVGEGVTGYSDSLVSKVDVGIAMGSSSLHEHRMDHVKQLIASAEPGLASSGTLQGCMLFDEPLPMYNTRHLSLRR